MVYTKAMFCVKAIVYTTRWFTQKPCYAQKPCFTQKYVLPRPVQVLFAACKTALSIVAGGTRRRQLSNTIYPMHFHDTSKMKYQWDLNFWLHLIIQYQKIMKLKSF